MAQHHIRRFVHRGPGGVDRAQICYNTTTMGAQSKQDFICRKANQNQADLAGEHILWSRHGIAELINEGWHRVHVEAGLQDCEIIENYPAIHRPLPDCLILGWFASGKPFHAVVAIDEGNDLLFVVTVYEPSLEEWEDDWKTRKP